MNGPFKSFTPQFPVCLQSKLQSLSDFAYHILTMNSKGQSSGKWENECHVDEFRPKRTQIRVLPHINRHLNSESLAVEREHRNVSLTERKSSNHKTLHHLINKLIQPQNQSNTDSIEKLITIYLHRWY